MGTRSAVRASVFATAVVAFVLVVEGPAFATAKVPGQHYTSLGLLNTILLFVVTPLGIFLVVSFLAVLPSTLSARRTSARIGAWRDTVAEVEASADEQLAIGAPAKPAVSVEDLIGATPTVADLVESPEPVEVRPPRRTGRGGAS